MATETIDNATPAGAPKTIEEALDSGFLPDDPNYRLTGKIGAATEEEEQNPDEQEHEGEEHQEGEHEEQDATPSERGDEKAAAAKAASESTQKKTETSQRKPENRWAKLSRENRELKEKLARAEGREEARRETASSTRDTRQTSQAAADANQPRPEPKIDDVDPKTGKAKYATFNDYLADVRKWDRENILREVQQTTQRTDQQRTQEAAERKVNESMNDKFIKARTKYADFDKVALGNHLTIPKGSVVDMFLVDSDHAGDVAYYLGQHPEICADFYECSGDKQTDGTVSPYVNKGTAEKPVLQNAWRNKITPQRQFRKLMEIEAKFSGAQASAARPASSVKPITRAGRPPHQTSGQGSVGKDAVEQAVEDGSFEDYRRSANERDPRVRALSR